MTSKLERLKAQRDALNDEIRLMEEGIRKAAYDACMSEQLFAINETRKTQGKRALTMSEFLAGSLDNGR